MPPACCQPNCGIERATLTHCIGVKALDWIIEHKGSVVNAQLLEEIKRLLRGNGADCVQLRCGSASKGPTCFHQQCYGRPVRLSKALTLYSKTKNNEGMEEYCMHDGRHRACDMCLMEVQGSTDCLYKGASGSTRGLTYKQRFQLLLDAARGGSAEALAQLSSTTECLVNEDIFYAAARAGQLGVCDWLLQQKCELQDRGAWVLAVAAEARHLELCQKLHKAGFPLHMYTKRLAVRAGRHAVLDWMREEGMPVPDDLSTARSAGMPEVPEALWVNAAYGGHLELMQDLKGDTLATAKDLPAVAHGCPLATLQQVLLECKHSGTMLTQGQKAGLMSAAVASPVPDWRDKGLWLLRQRECSSISIASREDAEQLLSLPDAAQRVEWLAGQGLGLQRSVYLQDAAASGGQADLVKVLWPEGGENAQGSGRKHSVATMVLLALQQGHLGLAQQLYLREGASPAAQAVYAAATAGRKEAVEWAVQVLREELGKQVAQGLDRKEGGGAEQQQQQQAGADREVQEGVLHAGGGVSGPGGRTVTEEAALSKLHADYLMLQAVESGSLEVVQWLVARGVPLGTGQLYTAVASGNELLAEWVVGQGYDMEQEALDAEPENSPYIIAASSGDMAMLRCLRHVGYPVPTDQGVFLFAVGECCCLPALQWMVEQGFAVDWDEVEELDQGRRPESSLEWDERSVSNAMWEQAQDE